MGRSFLFRVAKPKGDVLDNLGLERKRLKGLKSSFPFTNYCPEDSQMKNNHRKGTCLRDKATMKLVYAMMVNTSWINDYQV
jgi:hypothetical protein